MSELEKIILFASPLITLISLYIGWMRWKGGERQNVDSNAALNFSEAASKTAGLNERLQTQIEELVKDRDAIRVELSAVKNELVSLKTNESKLQDNNVELAKRVGVLSRNMEGIEREQERIRKWGYANAAEVTRLGGVPIRLEDIKG